MANNLHMAERDLASAVAFSPKLLDDLGIDPLAFTDGLARAVVFIVSALHRARGDGQPIASWELLEASGAVEERPLDEFEPSTLHAVLQGGSMLDGQAASNWRIVQKQYRWRQLVEGLATLPQDDVDTAILEGRKLFDKLENETPGRYLTVLSSAELESTEFPAEYLVPNVLIKGQPCIVAAPRKGCKTNLMTNLTLSLASGSRFLNYFHVPRPCRVAFFSGESGAATIKETAIRQARAMPWWNLSDYENAFWSFDLPKFGEPGSIADLRRFIRQNDIEVGIFDPAYLCIPIGDDNANFFKVGEHLQPLSRMAADDGLTPIVVHHTIKSVNVTDSPPELEDMSGAGFAEWCRQWLLISRREKYNPETPGSHRLWMAAGGSAGHSIGVAIDIEEGSPLDDGGRRWEVSVATIGKAIASAIDQKEQRKKEREAEKRENDIRECCDAVVKALEKNPEGLTFRQFHAEHGIRHKHRAAAFDRLEDAGTIERCRIAKSNGQEYDGFKLSLCATVPQCATELCAQ